MGDAATQLDRSAVLSVGRAAAEKPLRAGAWWATRWMSGAGSTDGIHVGDEVELGGMEGSRTGEGVEEGPTVRLLLNRSMQQMVEEAASRASPAVERVDERVAPKWKGRVKTRR